MAVSNALSPPGLRDLRPLQVAPNPPFTCGWSAVPGFATVRTTGELDRGTTPQLERMLGQAQRHSRLVLLDLRGLEFMDSSGMHAICDAHERAQLMHGRLAVIQGPARIKRLFELTGVCDVLELVSLDPAEPPVQALLKLSGLGARPSATGPKREGGLRRQPRARSTWCPSISSSHSGS